MKKIGLLSDTHGFVDPQIFEIFADVDQIWHAGDFGPIGVSQELTEFKEVIGVYGNIDDGAIREIYPLHQRFECEGLDVWITHIGGYPGKYDRRIKKEIESNPPDLFICGHSHVLKVKPDKKLNLLHLNPGAAGNHGFHQIKTAMLLTIADGKIQRAQAADLGPRGKKSVPPQPEIS